MKFEVKRQNRAMQGAAVATESTCMSFKNVPLSAAITIRCTCGSRAASSARSSSIASDAPSAICKAFKRRAWNGTEAVGRTAFRFL